MQRQRKHSEDGHSQSEEEAQFFPRRNADNLKQAIELLTHHYNSKQHSVQLSNCCFRCHHKHISQAYNQFRIKAQIQLEEPRISNFYENSQFVDLKKLVRSNNDGSILIPDPCILPLPKTLGYLLDELFDVYGYVPNLQRFLLYFPAYLQMHRAVEKDLFEKGKIDSKSAYFVGLCSAAELGSVYIMVRMLRNYLKSGGPTEWFDEDKLPQRLKCLKKLNRLMGRTPWLITADTIEDILQNNECHWTRNELAQYVQIIAFSHQISTIALSVGLLPEESCLLKYFNMQQILSLKQTYDFKSYESAVQNRQKLAVMIPVLKEFEQQSEKTSQNKQEMSSKKELKRSMRKMEVTDIYMKQINNELTKQSLYKEVNLCVTPLLAPFQIIEKRGETSKYHNVVDYSEYNYKFKAYPLLNNLTHQTADKIEAMISYSEIMTRGNFGNQKVNHTNVCIQSSFGNQKVNHTKEFRKAVRYYAQNLCGFTHHQYDFKWKVAQHLTMALKFYIRLVAMSPLHISRQVVRETNHEFGQIECFDLGHLAVLIANTKMSLQLMFVVQAFDL